jgi:hypothetical protein
VRGWGEEEGRGTRNGDDEEKWEGEEQRYWGVSGVRGGSEAEM